MCTRYIIYVQILQKCSCSMKFVLKVCLENSRQPQTADSTKCEVWRPYWSTELYVSRFTSERLLSENCLANKNLALFRIDNFNY